MDLCNKVLSKAPISWMDVQKQLLTVMQTRTTSMASNYSSSTGSFGLAINKSSVKQCTDLLIKHIKNLNQAQVIDQLNNFAQSCSLSVYTTPSEEEPTTVNAFLSNEDFFFSVWISLSGEITDVKFSLFSEEAKKNNLLKEMFRTWNWESLYKHIDGIKSNFILSQAGDQQVKMNAFKAIQCLEKELNSLYQIETKYLDKLNSVNRLNKPITPSSKYLDILVNQTPVGIFKKSELGEAMRLYYYLSPLDLIKHNSTTTGEKFDRTFNILTQLTVDQLLKHDLGAYLTISLQSTLKNSTNNETNNFKLPDCSLLLLNENDESSWCMYLDSYLNNNLSFEKKPLFSSLNSNSSFPLANFKQNGQLTGVEVPGAFLVKFNKPIVMCKNTLIQLQNRLGIETVNVETIAKLTPFFELLAKTEINSKILNDAYSVQLPDESQVYYITELDQPNCMGVLVEKLMFTQPQDLLVIIETIRKQLLFNELLLSCMKTMCSSAISITNNNNNNYKLTNYNHINGTDHSHSTNNVRILEIGLLAPFVVSIIMQHPLLLCYTTIEIDVSQGNIETKFRDHNDLHNPNVISEIIRRCHSIPVTIRALLMKYKQASSLLNKQRTGNNDNGNGNNGNGSNNNNEQNQKDGHGDDSENYNCNNNTNTNITNLNNKFNTTNGNQHDRNFDSDSVANDQINDANIDLQITPRSLTHPEGNFNFSPGANPTNSTAVLNRLTPSRRDSFNRTSSTSSSSSSSSGATGANLIKTPSSIFEFSNVINEQKQQQKHLMLIKSKSIDSPGLDRKNKETNDENKPNSNLINTPLLLGSNQFQTPSPSQNNKSAAKPGSSSLLKPNSGSTGSNNKTPLNSSNKKRKAPNNETQQSTSTPNSTTNPVNSTTANQSSTSSNTITQPPSAKRKMTQNLQDFKRHTSLIEDPTQIGNDILNSSGSLVTKVKSNNPNSSSVTLAKKPKLKNSISSVDLSSALSSSSTSSSKSSQGGKSSENSNTKKETVVSSGVNNSVKTNVKKEKELSSSGVLTAALINSNPAVVKTANSKLTNSTNKSLPTHLKKSQSNKQLNESSPLSNTTSTSANKQSTSLTSGSSSSGQLPMKIKPITEDGLKIRISKDSLTNKQRSNSSSSINNNSLLNKTGSNSNLSAAEIQLKQPVFSSPAAINSSINSINNTPASGIQDKSNRTPSPSPISSSLTTPSPIHHSDDSPENETANSSLPKYEPPVKQVAKQQNKRQTSDSIYNLKPSSAPLLSTAAIVSTANIKPNTPPLPASSNSLASFALGLGTGFKTSSFKIPHKSKTQTNSEDTSRSETDEKSSPLSTSSPASSSGSINRSVGSPSKSTTPPQSDLKTTAISTKSSRPSVSMPPPSNIDQTRSTGNQRTNNSSPKWQPSYHSGNISPRYNNNFDQTTASSTPVPLLSSSSSSNLSKNQSKNANNNNNNNSSNNNKHTINNNSQRSQSAGSRPLTPIPSFVSNQHHQLNNNGSNRLINNFNKTPLGPPLPPLAHPVPLMNQSKTIPSLMSFSNHLPTSSFSAKDSLMTPTSPVNDKNPIPMQETKIIKESREVMSPTPSSSASSIPQPPDSPICESAPIVIPKLIPLERNLSTPSIIPTSNNNDYYNQSNKAKTNFTSSSTSSSKIKTNIADIASPDTVMHSEEDDDNLVIDLIPTNYSNKHLISSGSSGSLRSNSRNVKSPCILEEDLVNNEALIS